MPAHLQDEIQHLSLTSPDAFWSEQASHLHWHTKPSCALVKSTKTLASGTTHDHWEWFPEGEMSTCFNCVDRHVLAGNGEEMAVIWDSPVTGGKERVTYARLLVEVEVGISPIPKSYLLWWGLRRSCLELGTSNSLTRTSWNRVPLEIA